MLIIHECFVTKLSISLMLVSYLRKCLENFLPILLTSLEFNYLVVNDCFILLIIIWYLSCNSILF